MLEQPLACVAVSHTRLRDHDGTVCLTCFSDAILSAKWDDIAMGVDALMDRCQASQSATADVIGSDSPTRAALSNEQVDALAGLCCALLRRIRSDCATSALPLSRHRQTEVFELVRTILAYLTSMDYQKPMESSEGRYSSARPNVAISSSDALSSVRFLDAMERDLMFSWDHDGDGSFLSVLDCSDLAAHSPDFCTALVPHFGSLAHKFSQMIALRFSGRTVEVFLFLMHQILKASITNPPWLEYTASCLFSPCVQLPECCFLESAALSLDLYGQNRVVLANALSVLDVALSLSTTTQALFGSPRGSVARIAEVLLRHLAPLSLHTHTEIAVVACDVLHRVVDVAEDFLPELLMDWLGDYAQEALRTNSAEVAHAVIVLLERIHTCHTNEGRGVSCVHPHSFFQLAGLSAEVFFAAVSTTYFESCLSHFATIINDIALEMVEVSQANADMPFQCFITQLHAVVQCSPGNSLREEVVHAVTEELRRRFFSQVDLSATEASKECAEDPYLASEVLDHTSLRHLLHTVAFFRSSDSLLPIKVSLLMDAHIHGMALCTDQASSGVEHIRHELSTAAASLSLAVDVMMSLQRTHPTAHHVSLRSRMESGLLDWLLETTVMLPSMNEGRYLEGEMAEVTQRRGELVAVIGNLMEPQMLCVDVASVVSVADLAKLLSAASHSSCMLEQLSRMGWPPPLTRDEFSTLARRTWSSLERGAQEAVMFPADCATHEVATRLVQLWRLCVAHWRWFGDVPQWGEGHPLPCNNSLLFPTKDRKALCSYLASCVELVPDMLTSMLHQSWSSSMAVVSIVSLILEYGSPPPQKSKVMQTLVGIGAWLCSAHFFSALQAIFFPPCGTGSHLFLSLAFAHERRLYADTTWEGGDGDAFHLLPWLGRWVSDYYIGRLEQSNSEAALTTCSDWCEQTLRDFVKPFVLSITLLPKDTPVHVAAVELACVLLSLVSQSACRDVDIVLWRYGLGLMRQDAGEQSQTAVPVVQLLYYVLRRSNRYELAIQHGAHLLPFLQLRRAAVEEMSTNSSDCAEKKHTTLLEAMLCGSMEEAIGNCRRHRVRSCFARLEPRRWYYHGCVAAVQHHLQQQHTPQLRLRAELISIVAPMVHELFLHQRAVTIDGTVPDPVELDEHQAVVFVLECCSECFLVPHGNTPVWELLQHRLGLLVFEILRMYRNFQHSLHLLSLGLLCRHLLDDVVCPQGGGVAIGWLVAGVLCSAPQSKCPGVALLAFELAHRYLSRIEALPKDVSDHNLRMARCMATFLKDSCTAFSTQTNFAALDLHRLTDYYMADQQHILSVMDIETDIGCHQLWMERIGCTSIFTDFFCS